jgi:hypothetical protein
MYTITQFLCLQTDNYSVILIQHNRMNPIRKCQRLPLLSIRQYTNSDRKTVRLLSRHRISQQLSPLILREKLTSSLVSLFIRAMVWVTKTKGLAKPLLEISQLMRARDNVQMSTITLTRTHKTEERNNNRNRVLSRSLLHYGPKQLDTVNTYIVEMHNK